MQVIYKHDSVVPVRVTDSRRAQCPCLKAAAKGSSLIRARMNFSGKLVFVLVVEVGRGVVIIDFNTSICPAK